MRYFYLTKIMDIKIVDLFKSYDNKTVIKSINLELLSGEIYCLVGKNGAGKSTLFNIIAGLVNQDKGKIKFDNKSYKNIPNKVKRHIGFKGDVSSLIEELTAFQYLKLIGLFYRVNKTDLNLRIPQIIDYFFEEFPLNLSLDFRPAYNLIGHQGYWYGVALSVRYVF